MVTLGMTQVRIAPHNPSQALLSLGLHLANMPHERNPGVPLNLAWVESVHVNLSAIARRVETHKNRRSVKMDWQAAWLLRAVACTDLTALSGDDTASNVERLCFKAKNPVRQDLIRKLGVENKHITVGAVCVFPSRVAEAVKFLEGVFVFRLHDFFFILLFIHTPIL